jgi:ABC-type glycerol-3-phosphate transport system substrate-binding protein
MSDPTFADYPLLALTVEAASMGMADAAYFAPFPLSVRKPIADNAARVVAGEMTPEEAARAAIDAINAEIADAE